MKCNCEDCRLRSNKRRDYRQSAGSPADEIPHHKSRRGKRRRVHVKGCTHQWVPGHTGSYITSSYCAHCGKEWWRIRAHPRSLRAG